MTEAKNENNMTPVQQQTRQNQESKESPLSSVKTKSIPMKLEYAEDRSKRNTSKEGD